MNKQSIPAWVWILCALLGALQPALHLWIAFFPPEGSVPTGLHIPDSAIFLQSMEMGAEDFYSPYATCKSPVGDHDPSLYPMPYLWVYGLLGSVGRCAGLNLFLVYGFANGIGVFCFLIAAHLLLRAAAPGLANRAFLIFALGGGLGGAVFLATRAAGLQARGEFEELFFRFALYELMEGAHLLPVTYFPRLYYLLSLACCFGSMATLLRGRDGFSRKILVLAGFLLAIGSFINPRFGLFTAGLMVLYGACRGSQGGWGLVGGAILLGGLGWIPGWWLVHASPVAVRNHMEVGDMALWFSPFLTASALCLPLLPGELGPRIRSMAAPRRVAAMGALGYLAAFAILFFAYQAYWGNVVVARDWVAAAAISDPALLGALGGAAYALVRARRPSERETSCEETRPLDWVVFWFLGFLVVALSGFGRGWFLRFGPQRLAVFLWLPLSLLTAAALERMGRARPRAARVYQGAILICGILSIVVSTLYFQGPMGRKNARGPYADLHAEIMSENDARLLEEIPPGRVLARTPAADAVVRRLGQPVFFGIGSFNLSEQPYRELEAKVQWFFSEKPGAGAREAFLDEWEIEAVLCPDTWPVSERVIDTLAKESCLEEVARCGRGAVFRRKAGAERRMGEKRN